MKFFNKNNDSLEQTAATNAHRPTRGMVFALNVLFKLNHVCQFLRPYPKAQIIIG